MSAIIAGHYQTMSLLSFPGNCRPINSKSLSWDIFNYFFIASSSVDWSSTLIFIFSTIFFYFMWLFQCLTSLLGTLSSKSLFKSLFPSLHLRPPPKSLFTSHGHWPAFVLLWKGWLHLFVLDLNVLPDWSEDLVFLFLLKSFYCFWFDYKTLL